MSIEEAAQLILQAGSMGGDGEIFILRMGDPIKIDTMAREMIKLAGREPGSDIPITFTGLRPGEKLYEELITEGEGIVPTEHQKIMVLRNHAKNDLDREALFNRLFVNAGNHDSEGIKVLLQSIIPEYIPFKEVGAEYWTDR
jgi:FlaA1/EpsC-like NDP-sugar epimerase